MQTIGRRMLFFFHFHHALALCRPAPAVGSHCSRGGLERSDKKKDMMLLSHMDQDLHSLKDDMVAFIEGHGLRRFNAYVSDEVANVPWSADEDHPDAWKDFVELAKASGVSFVTMNFVNLDSEDVDLLLNRLQEIDYMNEEDVEEARWLRNFVAKVGFVQLGFPCQGVIFTYEVSTEWYEAYQRLETAADDYDGILIDDSDPEEE
jgi:hypothetical protein